MRDRRTPPLRCHAINRALEIIREQNPSHRILLEEDNYGSYHARITQGRVDELGIEFTVISPHSLILAYSTLRLGVADSALENVLSQTTSLCNDLKNSLKNAVQNLLSWTLDNAEQGI